ncbi:TetR family transcriptional regulator [Sphingosinicella soli]|uniref:AcrR family transcriptional regulator n=1 Tax=Sphingosinicella soli TaxID=333708 RepID=A0A7W7B576_9SPHN|nr:AcrR family transcriptional regulator [Sphingosinicella soli]
MPQPDHTPPSHVVNFRELLESRCGRQSARRNDVTADKLKAATVRLLETRGYHDIRIETVCKEAGLAKGTLYLHFADKEDLVSQVLEEYTDLQIRLMPGAGHCKTAFDALSFLNAWFSDTFCENVGLHRSLMQLSETIPRITEIWTNFLKRLSDQFNAEIRRWSDTPLSADLSTLATYCLWGMLDQALYAIYAVHRNPDFGRLARNRAFLIQSITLLQYRALFLENPDTVIDKSLQPLLSLKLQQ